ncbi:MAG: hypothetical protein K5840_07865 [Eubacterium sp.]|nr:hypothetical protein [Eubacterium sp.]
MSISSINSYAQSNTAKYYRELASGKKINSAADDPAGLAKAEKMEAQIRQEQAKQRNYAMSQAKSNVADAAYSGMADYYQEIAANDVMKGSDLYTASDLAAIDLESEYYADGISDLASQTTYNTQQVISSDSIDTSSSAAIYSSISTARSANGAYYNALSYASKASAIMAENTTAALSRTEDADMGKSSIELKKEQLLERYREQMQKRQEEEEKQRNATLFM